MTNLKSKLKGKVKKPFNQGKLKAKSHSIKTRQKVRKASLKSHSIIAQKEGSGQKIKPLVLGSQSEEVHVFTAYFYFLRQLIDFNIYVKGSPNI